MSNPKSTSAGPGRWSVRPAMKLRSSPRRLCTHLCSGFFALLTTSVAWAEGAAVDLLALREYGAQGPTVLLGEGQRNLSSIVGGFNTGFTQEDDGTLRAHGAEAELVLALPARTAYRGELELTPRRASALGVFVNGRRVARAALRGGRQSVRFRVPAAEREHADTYVTLAFHGRPRVAGRLFRGRRLLQKPKPEPVRARLHRLTLRPDGEAEAATTLTVHAMVPPGARLVARVTGNGSASVRATVRDQASASIAEVPAGAEPRGVEAPLTAFADEIVQFDLVTTGDARFVAAHVIASSGTAPAAAPASRPKNVILWFIDTLRADKLRCINPRTRVRTPNFDAFARTGVLFRRTLSQSSHSKPSAATVLTGHYPASHGARTHHDKVRRDVPLLSELFRQAGHETAGFASNGFIGKKHGFVRGWDTFQNLLLKGKPGKGPYLMAEVRKWFARRKRKQARKPFFLYVHSVDPHVPYNPPRSLLSMYWKGRYRGRVVPRRSGHQLDDARAGKFRVSAEDRRYVEALYDGEVTAADRYFGQMLDLLEGEGLAADTLVVVGADHGEELWEHGQPGHGHTLYNELIGVPLIFGQAGNGSPLVPGPRVVNGAVEMVDVAPTILDLAGLAVPERVQGRSLVPMMRAEEPVSPVAFSVHEDRIVAAQQGRFKYILYRGGAERVFDLDADPLEQKNLAGVRPHVRRHLRALLSTWLVRQGHHRKARDGLIGSPAASR